MLRAVAIAFAVVLLLTTLLDTSPVSAVVSTAVVFAPVAAIVRDAVRRSLAKEKLEKALGGVLSLTATSAPILARSLEGWFENPGDVMWAVFAALTAAFHTAASIAFYHMGLQEVELPEKRTPTPEERYALRERMYRRMNRWRIAAFGRISLRRPGRRRGGPAA